MATKCIIFDLDGTLVDSEVASNQALLDLLPDLSVPIAELVAAYRSRKLAEVLADVERRIGRALPADFAATYRARVAQLFEANLCAMPGAAALLESLDLPVCVASSGPPAKIRQALAVTGLARHFGDAIFSSYDLGVWKPDPGLFLHAAREMGKTPRDCLVVEDSPVGIAAAVAAGMRAVHYLPFGGSPASPMAIPVAHLSAIAGLVA